MVLTMTSLLLSDGQLQLIQSAEREAPESLFTGSNDSWNHQSELLRVILDLTALLCSGKKEGSQAQFSN